MKKLLVLLISLCMLLSLVSCAQKRDFGDSAKYEKGVAYVAGNISMDGPDVVSVDVEADSYTRVSMYHDEALLNTTRVIEYDGFAYNAKYSDSYVTDYQTVIDSYKTTDEHNYYLCLDISRQNGQIVHVTFTNNITASTYRIGYTKSQEHYIDLAKAQIKDYIDVDEYTARCVPPQPYSAGMYWVFFEKFVGDCLLTKAEVSILENDTIGGFRIETDYDWDSVRMRSIDGASLDTQIETKVRNICTAKSVSYNGYTTMFRRIVPDKNGRLAVLYMVYPNEPDDSPKCINPLNILIYIE